MPKTIIKVISGVGVVAGLGLAILLISSYALSQDVIVSFKVNPTLGGNGSICTAADGTSNAIAAGLVATVDCVVGYIGIDDIITVQYLKANSFAFVMSTFLVWRNKYESFKY
ncbi:MAG: hypothetical protein ACK5MU_04765 [Candidatus Saccharimonadales bacterium]